MIAPNIPKTATAIQGPRIHTAQFEGKTFDIYQDRGPDNLGYIGCCDGVPSVIGTDLHLVLSGLSRKHLGAGLPAGELVDFAQAGAVIRAKQRERARLT